MIKQLLTFRELNNVVYLALMDCGLVEVFGPGLLAIGKDLQKAFEYKTVDRLKVAMHGSRPCVIYCVNGKWYDTTGAFYYSNYAAGKIYPEYRFRMDTLQWRVYRIKYTFVAPTGAIGRVSIDGAHFQIENPLTGSVPIGYYIRDRDEWILDMDGVIHRSESFMRRSPSTVVPTIHPIVQMEYSADGFIALNNQGYLEVVDSQFTSDIPLYLLQANNM